MGYAQVCRQFMFSHVCLLMKGNVSNVGLVMGVHDHGVRAQILLVDDTELMLVSFFGRGVSGSACELSHVRVVFWLLRGVGEREGIG